MSVATLNRYRILNAILALREFTVADLAHYAGVKETTVRTVLGRDERFVERDGVVSQSRRGGQQIRYRLKVEASNELIAILRQLEGLGASLPPLVAERDGLNEVVLSLLAAEDILLRQLPQARRADRPGLIGLAAADYDTVPPSADPDAATHRRVVELLLRLAEIEQESLTEVCAAPETDSTGRAPRSSAAGHEVEKRVEALARDLRKLLEAWPQLHDRTLLPDLVGRIGNSCFGRDIQRRLMTPSSLPAAQ